MLNADTSHGLAIVVGAGAMGSGIAALLANSGWNVLLLDIAGPAGDKKTRNQAAIAGVERIRHSRPPLLYLPEFIERIQVGNIEDDVVAMQTADWIIEAVAEKMTIKQSVMERIETYASADAVISTNTSGLNLREITTQRSPAFRQRFLGTHFFNPPRYLPLVELIRLPETASDTAAGFMAFAEHILGCHVVEAKDTPGFISNRIGTWHLLDSIHTAMEQGLSIEETDYFTGVLLGRPKTATFRLADLIGFDVIADIARNQYTQLPDDKNRDRLILPDVMQRLINSGRLGQKTGAGFYKKENGIIQAVNIQTLEYHPLQSLAFPEINALMEQPLETRFARLLHDSQSRWGRYLNTIFDNLNRCIESIGGEIADSPLAIDQVMTWGFGWQIGPCAIADLRSPDPAKSQRYYSSRDGERRCREFATFQWRVCPSKKDSISLSNLKAAGRIALDSAQATLIDIGEDVACLEFHTKMNTFTPEMTAFMQKATEFTEQNFAALVIGNQERHWSAGYNLNLFLQSMAENDWNAIDRMLFGLQAACLAVKYARIPVIAAVHGYTLGGGCECALHCAAMQASSELYIGLPEALVGVLPAGGGTTALITRAVQGVEDKTEILARLESLFERLTKPKTTGSAFEAKRFGWLQQEDEITREPDRLLFAARQRALDLRNSGYIPPVKRGIRVPGAELLARLRVQINDQYRAGKITSHDRKIFDSIAFVLSGGGLHYAQDVPEDVLLRLEREAFIELVHEPKTAERMRHILATGKPLKN